MLFFRGGFGVCFWFFFGGFSCVLGGQVFVGLWVVSVRFFGGSALRWALLLAACGEQNSREFMWLTFDFLQIPKKS
jgi:hypothetical protein